MAENAGVLRSQVAVRSPNAPRIVSNRRTIDNRFPVLAFTIQAGDFSHVEILITTNRALFDPARASERIMFDPARDTGVGVNFFVSRLDGGLLPNTGSGISYVVPQAVLAAFANTQPRPSALYYVAVGYRSPGGGEPVYSIPVDQLTRQAPSVLLSADFRGHTARGSLSSSLVRVQRFAGAKHSRARGASTVGSRGTAGAAVDSASGEDGFGQALATEDGSSGVVTDYPGEEGEDDLGPAWEGTSTASLKDTILDGSRWSALAKETTTEPSPGPSDAFDYDDGFGAWPGEIKPTGDRSRRSGGAPALGPAAMSQPFGYADEAEHCRVPSTPDASSSSAAQTALRSYYESDDCKEQEPRGIPATARRGLSYGEEDEGEPRYDDEWDDGSAEYDSLESESLGMGGATDQAPATLEIDDKLRILDRIAEFESSTDRYSAINADGEFEGRFRDHPAIGRYHIGLSFGFVQFTQDSGNLGKLLRMMSDRDAPAFRRIFGDNWEELLRVTNAEGPPSRRAEGGRSARVQPVGGADLWQEPWVSRFRKAGQHPPFQAAQNELASRLFLDPMLHFCAWLGLETERAVTLAVDRAVQMGIGGARRWIIGVVGPIQTAAQRNAALTALGHADLASFQRSVPGLAQDNDWGPLTHAAMVAALRELGERSPVAIPTSEQMVDSLVRAATGERWGHRVQTIRNATDEGLDRRYQLI